MERSHGIHKGEFKVTTRFPEVEMIITGMVLEIVGYLGARPWRSEPGFLMQARQLAGAIETNACSSSENDGNMEI